MTYYEVNLSDVAENYKTVAAQTTALVVPMLKADAYGLGAQAVRDRLMDEGVHTFAVSRPEEALALEKEGVEIWCLACCRDKATLETMVDHGFSVAVDSLEQCRMLSDIAQEKEKKVRVHVAIDTGFGRFGFAPSAVEDIAKAMQLPGLEAQGIYSHLAAAFFPKDRFADRQLEIFQQTVQALAEKDIHFTVEHIAGSSAFFRDKKFHLDAVRIGSALCGRLPVPCQTPLKRVGHLYSEIIDLKTLEKGHNVGYGKVYRTSKKVRTAVLAVGSADGVQMKKEYDAFRFRDFCRYALALCKLFFKRDKRMRVRLPQGSAPVLGRVALTTMVIDVSGLECAIGDRAEIPISPLQVGRHIERRYL